VKVNIRKGRGIKPAAAVRNWPAIVMAGMALLTGVSCQDQVVESPAEADMSFWIELKISDTMNLRTAELHGIFNEALFQRRASSYRKFIIWSGLVPNFCGRCIA
jgi:hypothetical protein